MQPDSIQQVKFDRTKHPGIEFDIFPLEQLKGRTDLDPPIEVLHRVGFYNLLFIQSGTGIHTTDFEDHPYGPGCVVTVRKDQIHCFKEIAARGYLLLFTEEFLVSYLEPTGAHLISELFNELLYPQSTQLTPDQSDKIGALVHDIEQEFAQPLDAHTSGIIRNLLQVLVSRLLRIRKADTPQPQDSTYLPSFLQLQRLVETQCTQTRSVKDYAEQMGVTPKTLSNITHRILGKSPKAFIDETATLQIKRLLINSSLSVKEIAYQTGFEEPTNLFKFFKRYTQLTPQEFRERYASFSW
ncbi:MAG: helix-turn-helix domain-containing protein [Bacteroidota bacterium]